MKTNELIEQVGAKTLHKSHRGPYTTRWIVTPNGKRFHLETATIKGEKNYSLTVENNDYVVTPDDMTMANGFMVMKDNESSCYIPEEKVIEILKLN